MGSVKKLADLRKLVIESTTASNPKDGGNATKLIILGWFVLQMFMVNSLLLGKLRWNSTVEFCRSLVAMVIPCQQILVCFEHANGYWLLADSLRIV